MNFVVGDIHGEVTKLRKLVDYIDIVDPKASLIFIGDYLDKGEDVLATLRYLVDLSKFKHCTFLIGNHEFLWLNLKEGDRQASEYLFRIGAERTTLSLGLDDLYDAKRLLIDQFSDFFSGLLGYWSNKQYLVVHSGVDPLYFRTNIEFIPLENLLFNRYNFITYPELYQDMYKIVFGHTGFYYPYTDDYKIGVDTAACFLKDQPLTAFCLEEECFLDSAGKRYGLIELKNKDVCPNIPRVKPWREKNVRF